MSTLLREFGRGLADVVFPPVCVDCGGLVEAGELLLGPARQALADRVPGAGGRPLPTVTAALLGNAAGLVGAADLLRDGRG